MPPLFLSPRVRERRHGRRTPDRFATYATRTCSRWRVPWDAVASALMAQCPLRDVEAALGLRATAASMPPDSSLPPSAAPARSELREVIPELNRLTALTLELPRWQTLMLARLAAREHSAPATTSPATFDRAACQFLSSEILGFLEAVRWPEAGSG